MDEFLKSLTTPYFWIGVVGVGILTNLASAWAQTALSRASSRLQAWLLSRSASRRAERDVMVKRAMQDPAFLPLLLADRQCFHLNAISYQVFCIILLLAGISVEIGSPAGPSDQLIQWFPIACWGLATFTLFMAYRELEAKAFYLDIVETVFRNRSPNRPLLQPSESGD